MAHPMDSDTIFHALQTAIYITPLAGLGVMMWRMRSNHLKHMGEKIEGIKIDIDRKFDEKCSKIHEKINSLRTDLTTEITGVALKVAKLEAKVNGRCPPP